MISTIRKEKGITLIALVITIIILLILAGISIMALTDSGLFEKAKQAKEKNSIAEAKEKIELAIMDLRLEKELRGESLTIESLGELESDEISVGSTEKFPVEITCNRHKFEIDENFEVKYVEEADGTIITYTTDPEGYTNKDEITVKITVNNPKGIKTIKYPESDNREDLECGGQKVKEIDYKVTKNGTYTFKVIDNGNKETPKDIVINQIDRLPPKTPELTISDIKGAKFTIEVQAEDAEANEENVKSGIEKYVFEISNGSNKKEYTSTQPKYEVTGLDTSTTYSAKVTAYDNAGNYNSSVSTNVTTTEGSEYAELTINGLINDDPLNETLSINACDKDFTTSQRTIGSPYAHFKINPECWGKYLSVYCQTPDNPNFGLIQMGSQFRGTDIMDRHFADITGIPATQLCTRSVLIPEGANWGILRSGTASCAFIIYEVWCSEEDLTGNEYSNDNLPW